MMNITFLGTGTSQGVPVIACDCEVCKSKDSKDNRLRCSVLIEFGDKNFVIDTGPDFRQQMLRADVQRLDAILMTHEHKDHLAGLDDIRAFNYKQKSEMNVYATQRVQKALKKEFSYVFEENKYPGIPEIKLHDISNKPFEVLGERIIPIKVMHYMMPVFGFRIGDFTYITDAKAISETELEKIKGTKYLVLNALRKHEHISHFTLEQAIEVGKKIKPEVLYLTHISHLMGKHEEVQKTLPEFVKIAYDGLKISL